MGRKKIKKAKCASVALLIMIISTVAFGQQNESGFTDKNEAENRAVGGKKEGKWLQYLNENHDTSSVQGGGSFYILTIYNDDKPFGISREYYGFGKVSKETPFVDGKINGTVKTYYADGKRFYETQFKDGHENGVEKSYYKTDSVKSIATYVNGKRVGIVKEYYENGKLEAETPYKNGQIDGVKKEYYESGKLQTETIYKNGEDGDSKSYDENGKEVKE